MTPAETVAYAEAQLAERGTSPAGILLGDQPSRDELGALLGWADARVEESMEILKDWVAE